MSLTCKVNKLQEVDTTIKLFGKIREVQGNNPKLIAIRTSGPHLKT